MAMSSEKTDFESSLKKDYRSPTNELHKSMDILKINDIVEQEIVTFVHNYYRNNLLRRNLQSMSLST